MTATNTTNYAHTNKNIEGEQYANSLSSPSLPHSSPHLISLSSISPLFKLSSLLFLFLLFTISIFSFHSVTALQISPVAKTFILNNENSIGGNTSYDASYDLRIINEQHSDIGVEVTLSGLNGTISPASFNLSKMKNEQTVHVKIHEFSLHPGKNIGTITITGGMHGGEQFGSAVTLLHRVTLIRLYSGAFLDGNLHVVESKRSSLSSRTDALSDSLHYTLSLVNEGESATNCSATVLLSAPNNAISKLSLGTTTIGGGSEGKLEALQQIEPITGHYFANSTLTYNDPVTNKRVKKTFSNRFTIGNPSLRFLIPEGTINTSLVAGEINRLTLPAVLDWDAQLSVEAEVTLLDGEGKKVTTVKTSRVSFNPGIQESFSAFLELPNLNPGTYTVEVKSRSESVLIGSGSWNVEVLSERKSGSLGAGSNEGGANQLLLRRIFTLIILLLVVLIVLLATILRFRPIRLTKRH